MSRNEANRGAQNDARPVAAGRASHQLESMGIGGSTLVSDTVAPQSADRQIGSSRIDPDTRGVQWTVVGLVGLLGLTSFAVSFRALHDVAAWAGIGPGLQWAVPVFIDGAILTYALAVLVHRSRGEAVWPSWTSLGVFTAMSVAANAAHAVAAPQDEWWQTWVGAALAALAPLGVFAATEQMARLVVLRPQDRERLAHETAVPGLANPAGSAAEGLAPEPVEDAPESVATPLAGDTEETPTPAPRPEPEHSPEPEVLEVQPEPTPELRAESETQESAEGDVEAEEVAEIDDRDEAGMKLEEPSEAHLVAWVLERRREGEPITGPTVGAFLGVSERTGRNRIKELRAARPELFEEEAA